jgi:hypothetical protein
MTDDQVQSASNDRPEPPKPRQPGQDARLPSAAAPDTPAQGAQPSGPGRKPLFGS